MGLPEKWLEHVWVPAVVDKDSMIAATASFCGQTAGCQFSPRVAARSLAEWMSRAYDLVQESKEMADPKRAVKRLDRSVGESINPALSTKTASWSQQPVSHGTRSPTPHPW